MRLAMSPAALLAALSLQFCTTPPDFTSCPDPRSLTRDLAQPLATVRYLADDALEGRLAGSAGETCAAGYIAQQMDRIGLTPAGADGTWYQPVPLASAANPHAPGGTGRNVIGLLEGTDPALREELIIVGAHYDHLGRGGVGSLAVGDTSIHNGADDNASGVAAMLHAASLLAQARPARSVLFIAFTGEEHGLLGSAHFTREPTLGLDQALAMINLDMVGRLGDGELIAYGVGTAEEWPAVVERQAEDAGIRVATRPEGFGPSDHTSFYLRDIPVLHFFTNTHADYHRPSDDWQRIDADGLARIAGLVAGVARGLAEPPTRLTLVRGAGQPPGGGAARAGSGAYLGTVPDFTPVDRGVLLGGVTAGSPGDRAGMKRGDVLIRLGDHEVKDLEGFTEALQAYRPGDEVDIVVLRDGQELKLTAVLGRRGG